MSMFFQAGLIVGSNHGDYSITIDKESMLKTSIYRTQEDYRILGLNHNSVFFLPHETHIFGAISWEETSGSLTHYSLNIYEIKNKRNGWAGEPTIEQCNEYPYSLSSVNTKILNGGKLIWTDSNSTDFIFLNDSYEQLDTSYFYGKRLIPSYNGTFAYDITESVLYTMQIDAMGNVTLEKLKDLPSLLSPDNEYGETRLDSIRINDDASVLFFCESVCMASKTPGESARRFWRTKVYSIDFLSEDVFTLIQTYDNFEPEVEVDGGNSVFCIEYGMYNADGNIGNSHDCNKLLYPELTRSQVLGLVYHGEYYYKHTKTSLTALPEDVVKGRTFMGRNGSPEIGTLEV